MVRIAGLVKDLIAKKGVLLSSVCGITHLMASTNDIGRSSIDPASAREPLFKWLTQCGAGVLMHLTSLPGAQGIGVLSQCGRHRSVDRLSQGRRHALLNIMSNLECSKTPSAAQSHTPPSRICPAAKFVLRILAGQSVLFIGQPFEVKARDGNILVVVFIQAEDGAVGQYGEVGVGTGARFDHL